MDNQLNSININRNNENIGFSKKQWFIAAVIIPVVATIIIPLLLYFLSLQNKSPKFIIVNSILRSDDKLIIKAENAKANKDKKLNILFDGCSFPKAGIQANFDNNGMQLWHFQLSEQTKVENLLRNGTHIIQVGFPGENFSNGYKIIFSKDQSLIDNDKTDIASDLNYKKPIMYALNRLESMWAKDPFSGKTSVDNETSEKISENSSEMHKHIRPVFTYSGYVTMSDNKHRAIINGRDYGINEELDFKGYFVDAIEQNWVIIEDKQKQEKITVFFYATD